ncbi:MAG TPA: hypothetical protein VEO92_04465, partial [Candidatus Nitrosocosmicus sp.]|nr:hypothetical protein [Candidatus Nitrosocosmicus sp.]
MMVNEPINLREWICRQPDKWHAGWQLSITTLSILCFMSLAVRRSQALPDPNVRTVERLFS